MAFDIFTAESNLHLHSFVRETFEKSFSKNVLKTNGWKLQIMIKEVKLFSFIQSAPGVIWPCPLTTYMYKIG